MARKVTDYKVHTLTFDPKLVEAVMNRHKKGESLANIAKALKIGKGKAAMGLLIATTDRISIDDPAAITKDRRGGSSWGRLAARYGVTEGTARATYEAAADEPASALDFRRKARAV